MSFVKPSANLTPLKDAVFAVSNQAELDRINYPNDVVNATIGSLFNEERNLVAYNTVFDSYNKLPHTTIAAYAKSFKGNPDYCDVMYQFITQDNTNDLYHETIATPGGTGAIASSFHVFLEAHEKVILPDIAWGSYKLMAEVDQLQPIYYSMFEEDHFNLKSLIQCIEEVSLTQDRILFVLNDPCHNPTGYSLSNDEWIALIDYLNEKSKTHQIILLNDIAYIDYSYHLNTSRNYMKHFSRLNKNVMVVIAFSCSKTFTSYGLRCGGAIILNKEKEIVEQTKVVYEKFARATWSNIPNAAMVNVTNILTTNKDAFLKEKEPYIALLKKRSSLFIQQANACKLPMYPYKEGFFITIPIKDNKLKAKYFDALIQNHIYTVQVNMGIRIAICSLPLNAVDGLALKLKTILDSIK